jgi:hypothetical protein
MKKALFTLTAALTIYTATAEPTYIMVRKKFSKIVMKYVNRPSEGKLKRWYYDQNNDTYYRAKGFMGIFAIPIIVKGNSIGNESRRKEAELEQMYSALQNERNKPQTTAQQPIIINTPNAIPATVQAPVAATPVVYQPERNDRDDQLYRNARYDRSDRNDRNDRNDRYDYAERRREPDRHVIIEHRYYPRPAYDPYYAPHYYRPYRPMYYPY